MIPIMDREHATSVTLTGEMLERATALIPRLDSDPELGAIGKFTRHKVLRLAVAKGIAVLEEQYGKTKPKRKK